MTVLEQKQQQHQELSSKRLTIVYASQTGQAKVIAETINDQAIEKKYTTTLHCISKHDIDFKLNELSPEEPLIFVCSTTGDGETPETARRCWHKLKRLEKTETNQKHLINLNYALLGLGDTNYAQFCNGPKLFHARFLELGANCFFGPSWADDGTSLDLVVEPFLEQLWPALEHFFAASQSQTTIEILMEKNLTLSDSLVELTLPDLVECHLTLEECGDSISTYDLDKSLINLIPLIYPQSSQGIFKAMLTKKSVMTKPDAQKTCFNVKFKLIDSFFSSFEYEPGYSIDIVCPNSSSEIEQLLERLNVNSTQKNQPIRITSQNDSKKLGSNYVKLSKSSGGVSLEFLFKHCLDVRVNCLKKSMLRMLASYCSDRTDELKLLELCSKEGSDLYMKMVRENSLTLLDILNTFKTCQPNMAHLIQMLPGLTSRAYTLCSYHDTNQGSINEHEMEIVFNLIHFEVNECRTYRRTGVATGFLSSLHENESFYFLKRKFQNFTFPSDNKHALILIGPGTGISPFVSYLRQQRYCETQKEHQQTWLFYGCRDPFKDFLFKDEMLNVLSVSLTKLAVAYSQFEADKSSESDKFYVQDCKYVQDCIKYYSREVVSMLVEQNGSVYLCGDAKNMSKDVVQCLTECLVKEKGFTMDEAKKYLTNMISNKRLKQDIWA